MRARDLWLRIRALARPRRVERDLQDELAFHLEREMRRLVDEGRPRAGGPTAGARAIRVGRVDRRSMSRRARVQHNGVFTVIGVAAFRGQHTMYVPSVGTTSHFLVRTAAPAAPLVPAIRETALAEAPNVPIVSARTLAAIDEDTRASTRRDVMTAGAIGLVALGLAAVGLYAVVAVAIGQRIREIGVRTALGADRRRIVRLFVGRGLRLSLVGMTLGLAASAVVVRLLSLSTGGGEPAAATLVGVSCGVAVFVLAVALLASWLPARRAGGVAPLSALRVE